MHLIINYVYPGIPTTIKTMGVDIITIDYLRVSIIEIGSTIILMVVEAQGIYIYGYLCLQHLTHKLLTAMSLRRGFREAVT